MPIVMQHHRECPAPLRSVGCFGYDCEFYCDCYDGPPDEDGPYVWQPRGSDEGERTIGERYVRAALNWNQDIEDMT